ncbi:MAG: DUF2934 domain-containing protein [Verrucomicrobiota bacterium]
MPKSIQQQPSHDEIARLAYELWEQSAKPPGQDVEFWLKAEQRLRSQALPTPRQQPTRKAPQSDQPRGAASFARTQVAPAARGPMAPVSKGPRASVRFGAAAEGAKQ